MSPEVLAMVDHLDALNTFVTSPAHEGYIAAREAEIATIKERILLLVPTNTDNIAMQLLAHGELECQIEMLKTFEQARVTLKARIDEMVERDNQNAINTKV